MEVFVDKYKFQVSIAIDSNFDTEHDKLYQI